MSVIFVPQDENTVVDCDPDAIADWVRAAERRGRTAWGEVYYGPESTASPQLCFMVIPGAGVCGAVRTGDRTDIHVDSGNTDVVYPVDYGQDHVRIPRAFVTPTGAAIDLIRHFCATGRPADDGKWVDYDRTGWDLYA